jgi:hypothetical protein
MIRATGILQQGLGGAIGLTRPVERRSIRPLREKYR